jgi:hypothetical protein
MLLLSDNAIDRVVAWRRYEFFAGLLLVLQVFILPKGWTFGILPGFMLFGLGIYGLAFRKWRTEPGLWMLALFLFLVLGFCYAYFVVLDIQLWLAPAARNAKWFGWDQIRFAGEVGIGLSLFQYQVRLFLSVLVENFRRTQ